MTSFFWLIVNLTYFTHCSSVSIANFEHVTAGWAVACWEELQYRILVRNRHKLHKTCLTRIHRKNISRRKVRPLGNKTWILFYLLRYFHLIKNTAHFHRKKFILSKYFLSHNHVLKLIQETVNFNRISTKATSIYPKRNNHLTTELSG